MAQLAVEIDMCEHFRQIHKQTYVELQRGKWTPSTLAWMCLDCQATGFKTPKEAFMSDDVRRKTEITRDDRTANNQAKRRAVARPI